MAAPGAGATWLIGTLAGIFILMGTGNSVAVPLYVDSLETGPGSDPFFVTVLLGGNLCVFFFVVYLILRLFTNQITPENSKVNHVTLMIIGACGALGGSMQIYAAPTWRTSGFLQAVLGSFTIPLTVGIRYAMLRRGVQWRQGLATAIVVGGIVLSLIPTLTHSDQSQSSGGPQTTALGRVLWPVAFMLSSAPAVVASVILEHTLQPDEMEALQAERDAKLSADSPQKMLLPVGERFAPPSPSRHASLEEGRFGLKKAAKYTSMGPRSASRAQSFDMVTRTPTLTRGATGTKGMAVTGGESGSGNKDAHMAVFLAWLNLYQELAIILLFWTDLIPDVGMSASAGQLLQRFRFGISCSLGIAPECGSEVVAKCLVTLITMAIAASCNVLLMRYAEGANFNALINAATAPLTVVWFALFHSDPVFWNPHFSQSTLFTIIGLLLICPGIWMYHRYSPKLH